MVEYLGEKSHVVKASTTSKSIRTTIPEKIAKELDISVGDVLDWVIEEREGKKVAIVRKMRVE